MTRVPEIRGVLADAGCRVRRRSDESALPGPCVDRSKLAAQSTGPRWKMEGLVHGWKIPVVPLRGRQSRGA